MKSFLVVSVGLTILFNSAGFAQQSVSTDVIGDNMAKPAITQPKVKLTANINKVQMEATIRASQEQPKVLTIVPWQLPQYTRIAGQAPSVATLPQLSPLFRESFVAEQKVYLKLFKSNSNP
ncbi:MAG: hypothetical protein ACI9C4_001828 [Paraglaciecola sp.]|jgi:hypothetical protein